MASRCEECEFHYYTTDAEGRAIVNEAGWRCCACGHRPGEPEGYSPQLDREEIGRKVFGLLHTMVDAGIVYVSNATHGDGIVAMVADRCVREDRFDAYSIAHAILDGMVESHATYWRKISAGILAGHDPRDRCPCGALSTCSTLVAHVEPHYWKHRCAKHAAVGGVDPFGDERGGPGAGPQRELFR